MFEKKLFFPWFVAFLLLSLPAWAVNLGPDMQKMPNVTFEILANGTDAKSQPSFLPYAKLLGKATAILYWKVGDAKSETELKAFQNVAKLKSFEGKIHFYTAVKTTNDKEKAAAIQRARELKLEMPLILDRNQIGPYLYAFWSFPKYGLIDKAGYIKIYNCNALGETVGPRTTFLKALKMAAEGKEIPHYKGFGKSGTTHDLVDKPLPDVGLDDENGTNRTTSQFLSKKPSIVVFWSATCDHCRSVLPVIAKYWQTRKGNMDMLSITRAPSKELKDEITKLFKESKVTWPVGYAPENATLSFFKIVKVPTVILVDKEGKIVHTWIQPDKEWIARAIEAALLHYKLF